MSHHIFVDTGAWKAFVDRKDEFHHPVKKEFDSCRASQTVLLTTEYVLSETFTLLRMRAGLGHPIAVQFGEMVQKSQVIQIARVSEEIFQKSWLLFKKYHDKDFSFVDCTSFALMEEKGIHKALTLDRHFAQYGFEIAPNAPLS